MKHLLQITTAVLISLFISLLLCAGVAYAWVYKVQQEFEVQARAQKRELEEIKADAEARIAVALARRDTTQAKPAASSIGKDEAWAVWYQLPEHCGVDVSEADFVGCVNHKMLARKEFERVWQKGMN